MNNRETVSKDVIIDFISASFPQRLVAWIFDQAVLVGILLPLSYFYFDLGNIALENLQTYSSNVIQTWVIFNISYFSILEWLKGQTIGKKLMGIIVMNENGNKIDLKNSILRRIGLVAIGLLGVIMIFDSLAIIKTSKNQRLFDLLAGSLVMKKEYRKEAVKLLRGKDVVQDLKKKGVIKETLR